MDIEKRFKNFMATLQKVTLLKEEKEAMRSYLVDFMKGDASLAAKPENSLNNQSVWNVFNVAKLLTQKPILQYGFLSFLIMMFLGSGISLAAQKSLPGDLLYPVKTKANEKVLGMVIVSHKAKAEYSIKLAQLRLEEAEKLAVEGKLDSHTSKDASNLFSEHIVSAKSHIKNIEDEAQDSQITAVTINSDLEASLHAHADILNKISAEIYREDIEESKKNHIKELLMGVESNIKHIEDERYRQENTILKETDDTLSAESKKKFTDAQKEIQEASDVIEHRKSKVSVDTYNTSKINLELAKNTLAEGKAELDSGSYRAAFALSQLAGRMAKETKVSMEAEANLKIKLNALLIEDPDIIL